MLFDAAFFVDFEALFAVEAPLLVVLLTALRGVDLAVDFDADGVAFLAAVFTGRAEVERRVADRETGGEEAPVGAGRVRRADGTTGTTGSSSSAISSGTAGISTAG